MGTCKVLLFVGLWAFASITVSGESVIVQTTQGGVRGTVSSSGSHIFRGIPYAKPPLRWQAPQPFSWTGVIDTKEFSPSCHNTIAHNVLIPTFGSVSEDCLYLNVWVPPTVLSKQKKDADVIVFLHGGGFILGSASHPMISPDPELFAINSHSIFVSLNYRLGVLGFLAHPSLFNSSGVLGILDQIEALKWVQRNIAAFGGNPNSVTLMGESAGAFSICLLVTSPVAEGLFHRAIMQSSFCDFPFNDIEDGFKQGDQLVKSVGCHQHKDDRDIKQCLLSKSPDELIAGLRVRRGILFYEGVLWFPVIDGIVLPDHPITSIKQGKIHPNMKFLMGYNEDEAIMFIYLGFPIYLDYKQADDILESSVGPSRAYRISKYYRVDKRENNVRHTMNRMMSDIWGCSSHRVAEALSIIPNTTVYLYHYRHAPSWVSWPLNTFGAFHSAEMHFVFGAPNEGNFTMQEQSLSNTMMTDWATFSHTAMPQSPGWTRYSPSHRQHYEYAIHLSQGMVSRPEETCSLWDAATRKGVVLIPPETVVEPFISNFLNEGLWYQLFSWSTLYSMIAVLTMCLAIIFFQPFNNMMVLNTVLKPTTETKKLVNSSSSYSLPSSSSSPAEVATEIAAAKVEDNPAVPVVVAFGKTPSPTVIEKTSSSSSSPPSSSSSSSPSLLLSSSLSSDRFLIGTRDAFDFAVPFMVATLYTAEVVRMLHWALRQRKS